MGKYLGLLMTLLLEVAIMSAVFFAILAVAFAYVWRKGVLDWGPDSDPDYVRPPKPGPAAKK